MTPIPTSPGRIMQHLLQHYSRTTEPGGAALSAQRVRAVLLATDTQTSPLAPLYELVQQAAATAKEPGTVATDHAAIIDWLDTTFASLAAAPSLDPQLEARIQAMLPVVAALAISERDFLMIGKHPLHKILDLIYLRGIGWHAGLGRAGKNMIDKMDKLETVLRSQFSKQPSDLATFSTELHQFFERETTAFTRLRDRMIATEQGRLKASSARQTVADALNEQMIEGQFPAVVADFLQGPWFDSMQLTLIKHGRDSSQWQRLLKITETLVWTVQPNESMTGARRQRLYKIIPQLPRELRELLVSLDNNTAEKDRVVAQIEEVHFQILRKQTLDRQVTEPLLPGPGKVRTQVAEQLLEQVRPLQQGQWFRIKSEQGVESRVCLALKLDEYQQMLFVNRTGARVMQKTFEEFSYLISSGVASALEENQAFSAVLRADAGLDTPIEHEDVSYRTPRKAIIFRSHKDSQSAKLEVDTAAESAPVTEPEEQEHQQAAARAEPKPSTQQATPEDNADAAAPASDVEAAGQPPLPAAAEVAPALQPLAGTAAPTGDTEAAGQPPLPAAAEVPSPPAPQPLTGATPRGKAKQPVKPSHASAESPPAPPEEIFTGTDMPIGTWVRFHDTDGKTAKLAVRVESLDKYIFVDGRGVKKRELKTVQLQLLLDSGRAEPLGASSSFADTVSDIVKDFRSTDGEEG